MPTDVIDLGFFNPAYIAGPDLADAQGFSWLGGTAPSDAYMRDLHTRMKTKLEAENSAQNWSVGRIVRWQGTTDDHAYCWVIYHLDGTAGKNPTGKEFLFLCSGPGSPTSGHSLSKPNEVWETTGMGTHFHLGQTGLETQIGFLGLHYHTGGLLGAGFTYDVNEGSADFAAPTTNPYTDKAGFMPTIAGNPYPRGILNGDMVNIVGDAQRVCMVFNWEKPFFGIYRGHNVNYFVRKASIVGAIIRPRLSTDIYTAGGMSLAPGNNGGADGTLLAEQFATLLDDQGNQLDSVGDGNNYGSSGWVFTRNFTWLNQPRQDGTWDRDLVKLMTRSASAGETYYDKGYFDPDVCAVQGASPTMMGHLFDSPTGKSLKVSNQLTLPWADGYPIPFVGWPLNPQRKYDP